MVADIQQSAGDAKIGTIEVVNRFDPAAWDRYVTARVPNPLYHSTRWDRVFSVYRLPVIRLMALRDGEPVGVLSMVWQRSLLFGNHLVSLPWFDAAGIVADDTAARDALADAAVEEARKRNARVVQLRYDTPVDGWETVRTDKVLMRLAMDEDSAALWSRFGPKVRNQVRKGQKSGLTVEEGGSELLDDFYRIYSHNMRDLGSPAHSRRFFTVVVDAFQCETRVYLVRHEGLVIGAGMTLSNNDHLDIPWASSLRRYNSLCVNHVMYWHILERACGAGFRWFHFGRSTVDSGTYRFKRQWGAEPQQLYWYFLGDQDRARRAAMPPEESFGLATRVWQRLPVSVTRWAGPRIIAKVP